MVKVKPPEIALKITVGKDKNLIKRLFANGGIGNSWNRLVCIYNSAANGSLENVIFHLIGTVDIYRLTKYRLFDSYRFCVISQWTNLSVTFHKKNQFSKSHTKGDTEHYRFLKSITFIFILQMIRTKGYGKYR